MEKNYTLIEQKLKNNVYFSPLHQGIFLMAIGIFLYSISDMIVKILSERYSSFQIIFMRSAFALPLILFVHLRTQKFIQIFRVNIKAQIFRNTILSCASLLCIYSINFISMAEYSTFVYGAPLFVTIFSKYILKEKLTKKNLFIVFFGFFGIIISINPSIYYMVNVGSLIACSGALLYSLGIVLTSLQGRKTPPPIMIIWNTAFCTCVGFGGTLFTPFYFNFEDLIYFIIESLIHLSSSLIILQSFRKAPTSLTSSLNYTAIIWGTLFDYLLWGQIIEPHLILGALCIIGCGIRLLFITNKAYKVPDLPVSIT